MKQRPPRRMTKQEHEDRADLDAAAIIGVPVKFVKQYLAQGKTLSDLIEDKHAGKLETT